MMRGEWTHLAGNLPSKRGRFASERLRIDTLFWRERELWSKGVHWVAGVDEAGIGPLAGPVVAAAVVFESQVFIPGVNDSKQIGERERERLSKEIRLRAAAFCVAQAEVEEIERYNIYHAGLLAMHRAVSGLSILPQHLLIDGRRLERCAILQERIVGGDARCFSIAAASILAKTDRDALMRELDRLYPGYGLARHKGYPTREHKEALRKFGPTPIHRNSFQPVREASQSRFLVPQRPLFDSESEPGGDTTDPMV